MNLDQGITQNAPRRRQAVNFRSGETSPGRNLTNVVALRIAFTVKKKGDFRVDVTNNGRLRPS